MFTFANWNTPMRHTFPQSNSVRDEGILQLGHDVCMEGVFFWLDLEHNSAFLIKAEN